MLSSNTTSKYITFLGIDLRKYVKYFHTEKYKTLQKEISNIQMREILFAESNNKYLAFAGSMVSETFQLCIEISMKKWTISKQMGIAVF